MNLEITPRVQPADHYLLSIGVSIFYLGNGNLVKRRGRTRLTGVLSRGACLPRPLPSKLIPDALLGRAARSVWRAGECVVVRRKERFCCFFHGNRLVGERAENVHKIDHSGNRWCGNVLGCASPPPLIGLHLMASTLHTFHLY